MIIALLSRVIYIDSLVAGFSFEILGFFPLELYAFPLEISRDGNLAVTATLRTMLCLQTKQRLQLSETSLSYAYLDGLIQDCSNSNANALDILQSCIKLSICSQETSFQVLHNLIHHKSMAVLKFCITVTSHKHNHRPSTYFVQKIIHANYEGVIKGPVMRNTFPYYDAIMSSDQLKMLFNTSHSNYSQIKLNESSYTHGMISILK